MTVINKGTLLPEVVVSEMINKVKGLSSLARLSGQTPMTINGLKEYTFSMEKEVDIVAESGAKSAGGGKVESVTIIPVKFEYNLRVSDEFLYGTEEYRLDLMRQFADGFSRKLARGIDLAAFHGVNPRTGSASQVVGDNNFDAKVTQKVEFDSAGGTGADDALDEAVRTVTDTEGAVTGLAMAPAFGAAMAKVKVNGVVQYPEFRFGGRPDSFAGIACDVNNTVSGNSTDDLVIVGDFANMFRWGYAKEIPLEVIEYGNPDNDAEAGDLKGHNQVMLRAEAFVGWGILDPSSFARIVKKGE